MPDLDALEDRISSLENELAELCDVVRANSAILGAVADSLGMMERLSIASGVRTKLKELGLEKYLPENQ